VKVIGFVEKQNEGVRKQGVARDVRCTTKVLARICNICDASLCTTSNHFPNTVLRKDTRGFGSWDVGKACIAQAKKAKRNVPGNWM
jgi:hypothetical protein